MTMKQGCAVQNITVEARAIKTSWGVRTVLTTINYVCCIAFIDVFTDFVVNQRVTVKTTTLVTTISIVAVVITNGISFTFIYIYHQWKRSTILFSVKNVLQIIVYYKHIQDFQQ